MRTRSQAKKEKAVEEKKEKAVEEKKEKVVEEILETIDEVIKKSVEVSIIPNESINLDVTDTQDISPKVSSVEDLDAGAKQKPILLSGKESTADAKSSPKDSDASPEECKSEAQNPPVVKRTRKRKKGSIRSITKVISLVFFELETTGLPHEIGKSNVQITEISMIAIDREEFQESTYNDLRDVRIIQKLCFCTRPRSRVSGGAADFTGLDNWNLRNQNPFGRSEAEAINLFLSHLPKPVCLLAHNGSSFDFPLMKAEFSRLSISLPSDLFIADTLRAFRVLGVPKFPPEKKICESVRFTKNGKVSYALSNLYLYLFNKNPVEKGCAEGDGISLAKVCHQVKDSMLPWIDTNCKTFDSVSPMW